MDMKKRLDKLETRRQKTDRVYFIKTGPRYGRDGKEYTEKEVHEIAKQIPVTIIDISIKGVDY